ncbi:unnamed protein product [Cyprideis torosa]|uniref:Uncharacterized protein n=1 Tax=Cyprideis torosa TaxID=163714 RepID=A0A7R8ZVU8_9CRUS|nr:unnamed protein product [Cyprideis torosa]CAG0904131.1 unnamed protein product [Cyprideis torosa]
MDVWYHNRTLRDEFRANSLSLRQIRRLTGQDICLTTSVQTVITVDQNDQVFYYERYRPSGGSGERWIACHVSFRLKAPSEGHEQSSSAKIMPRDRQAYSDQSGGGTARRAC